MAFSVLVAAACGSCGGTVLRKIITLLLATQVKRGKSPEERKRIEATYGERLLERYMNILDNNNFWKTVAPCCRHQDSRLQTCSVQSPVPELPVLHRASGQAKP